MKKIPKWGLALGISLAIPLIYISLEPIINSSSPVHNILAPIYKNEQLPILRLKLIDLYTHLIGGALLVFCGGLQFSKHIRIKLPAIHRISGKIYFLLVMVVISSGIKLLDNPFGGWWEKIPAIFFGIVLLLSTILGILNIVFKGALKSFSILNHQKWMIISYSIVLGPMTVRIAYVLLWMLGICSERNAMTPSFWIGWGVNLLLACYFVLTQRDLQS